MSTRMLFVVGAPRSGTTMLERMLASHSQIQGGPEPHLLTPLAHLGVWAKVDKAPYDHILAAESQKLFVEQLPRGEQDYWDACRAYCDVLYTRYMEARGGGKSVCLDKTPAYALILPFMMKVFPDAKYVVLTRHPLAMFSSFANSFFDGDYAMAHGHNPVVNRYVPAMAAFLRQPDVPCLHVRYEDLVAAPEVWFKSICDHVEVPFEVEAINYGTRAGADTSARGLGDPIGVARHDRPSTESVHKWARELTADSAKCAMMRGVIGQLDPEDLSTFGYPLETLWQPLEAVGGDSVPPPGPAMNRYWLQRKAIVTLREQARKGGAFRKVLEKVRLTTDVLLRD